MKNLANNIEIAFILQTFFSILSAITVALISNYMISKRYVVQQWWEKRASRYEEIILLLADIERIYEDLVYQTSVGSNLNTSKFKSLNDTMNRIQILTAASAFYLDKGSEEQLKKLNTRMFEERDEFGSCLDNDLVYITLNVIKNVKETVIFNAKNELKR